MSLESQGSTIITEENINAFIDENMKRAENKYNQFTNYNCQDCKAILEIGSEKCPNCGSIKLAGLFTDGK